MSCLCCRKWFHFAGILRLRCKYRRQKQQPKQLVASRALTLSLIYTVAAVLLSVLLCFRYTLLGRFIYQLHWRRPHANGSALHTRRKSHATSHCELLTRHELESRTRSSTVENGFPKFSRPSGNSFEEIVDRAQTVGTDGFEWLQNNPHATTNRGKRQSHKQ